MAGAAFLFAGQTFDRWTDVPSLIGPRAWTYVSQKAALQFNSSLFGALHFSTVSLFGLWSGSHLLRIYVCIAPILFLLLIYYLVKSETDMWKQFLFLFIATLLLMPVSPHDRLLLLFVPFWLLARAQGARGSDLFYAVSIAALLIPNHYLFAYEGADQADRSFASISLVLNPLIMIAILSKGVRDALKTTTTPGMVS
jgi:predicted neutral ceramidase superfamily lipid hydrolase